MHDLCRQQSGDDYEMIEFILCQLGRPVTNVDAIGSINNVESFLPDLKHYYP